jgi:Bifunctional DNA primase/polymerase, N-terminal/AAA domain/Primase C terminal 2 (PriCT-2)
MTEAEKALEFIAQYEWPIFPCNPLDKRPLCAHGFKDATVDPDTIKSWWTQWPNAMIGVPMGPESGVFCVDLDRKENVDGVATWNQWISELGEPEPTRQHSTPSTGRHMVYIWEAGIRSIPLNKLGPGIEIKGDGGYIIVPPSRMADGREYVGNNLEPVAAPKWLLIKISNYQRHRDLDDMVDKDAGKGTFKEGKDDFFNYPPTSEAEIREALSNIPSDNYDDWYKLGGALRNDGWPYSLFEEWSRRSKKFNARECRKKWDGLKNISDLHIGTIFREAEKYAPGWRQAYWRKNNEQEKEQETKQTDKPLVLTNSEFIATYKPPSYIITGLLQKRFVYSLTGMTGSGKTCIALRIAAHVIKGLELSGRKVKKGKVLYFAGENPDDVLVRWIKLCEEMDIPSYTPMMHWLPGVPPLKNNEIRKRIYGAAQQYGPFAMVIIDTSAAYFQGDDENSNVQLGEHARLMRRFIALPGNPTVLVTCHPTKHPDQTNLLPRGGGAFLNEMDGNLSCARDNFLIEIDTHGKFRGPEFAPLAFRLHPCKLDHLKDEDGADIWSVITIPITDEEHTSIEDAVEKKRDELMTIMLMRPGLSLAELATELGWQLSDGKPNKSLVQRLVNKLVIEKQVEKKGGHYTLTKKAAEKLRNAQHPTGKQEDMI